MKAFNRVLAGLTMAMVAFVAAALPAAAITGGEPDGNRHPNVGLILFYDRRRPVPLLGDADLAHGADHGRALHGRHAGQHAGHLRLGDRRGAAVARSRSPPTRASATPPEEIAAAGYLSGTAYTHPEYSDFTDLDNWNDVGVIVLDEPVTGITPATLAPLNYLDQFAQPALNTTIFELVGYGTEVRKPETGPQKPQPMSYPLIRRYTTAPGQKLTAADPAAQRQPQRHPRRRRHLLRRLRRPGLPERLPRRGHQLRLHRELPLPRRLPARRHPGRPGLARHVRLGARLALIAPGGSPDGGGWCR